MRVRTLALYLIGDRQAILEIAVDRRALWIGLAFVLSAGLAREYDGQDLVREPWYLLIPVGASLAASFLLFLVACGRLFPQPDGPTLFSAYRSFLILFWMTAPLAWLYAIPYERFLSPPDAARASLATLALVAVWRVLLMVRVLSIITGRGIVPTFFLIMIFADATALTAAFLMSKPPFSIASRVRLSESAAVTSAAAISTILFGICTAPIWVIGGLIASFTGKPDWKVPARPADSAPSSLGIRLLAAGSLLIWLPILHWTQAEQRLRSRVEQRMKLGLIAESLDVMSAHAQSDFPPQWDPPPRLGWGESLHRCLTCWKSSWPGRAPWVRAVYLEKLRWFSGFEHAHPYSAMTGPTLARMVRILQVAPEGAQNAAKLAEGVKYYLSNGLGSQTAEEQEDRKNLNALLKLAEEPEVRKDR